MNMYADLAFKQRANQCGRPTRKRHASQVLVTITATGWLLISNTILAARLDLNISNRQAQVTVSGGSNQWHRIEASTDLLNWSGKASLYQSNSTSAWRDSESTNLAWRFYRSSRATPLDLYVAVPDTNYSYAVSNTIVGSGITTFVLELRSQVWLTTNDVNRTLWKHWLIIVRPNGVTNTQSLLYIDGGSNGGSVPGAPDANLAQLAIDTKTIVSQVKMVPNEPLMFSNETTNRTEDQIIAYSWDKYLRTGDTGWPAQLPMTKAAVRAMDTVTAFCASAQGGSVTVSNFVVAGGSKRGWTTWLTSIVDKRVVAIIPFVIDLLNVEPSFNHHYSAYCFWAPAIQDYVNENIPSWFGTPQFHSLLGMIDPYEYRYRLTLPKFMIDSAGDDFFLPDSAQFYFNDLLGVKYLRYVPNSNHSLSGTDAWDTLRACYSAFLTQAALPQFSWTLQSPGVLQVVTTTAPSAVNLWQATNPNARDFRLTTIGPAYTSSTLSDQGGGTYIGNVATPSQGWTAFFIELTYPASLAQFKFTTQVYVVPDTLPCHFP